MEELTGIKGFLQKAVEKEGKTYDDNKANELLKAYNNDYDKLISDIAVRSGFTPEEVEPFKKRAYETFNIQPYQPDTPEQAVDYGPFDKATVEKYPQAKQNFERWQKENTPPKALVSTPEQEFLAPEAKKPVEQTFTQPYLSFEKDKHPYDLPTKSLPKSQFDVDYMNSRDDIQKGLTKEQQAKVISENIPTQTRVEEPEDVDFAKSMLTQIDDLIKAVKIPESSPLDVYEKNYGVYAGGVDLGDNQRNIASTTKATLEKAKDYYEAVANGDANAASKFWGGLKTIDLENTLTLGIKGMANNVDIYQAAKNYTAGKATPEEENLLIAKSMLDEIQSIAQKDRAISVGTGLGEMAPWLAQFAVTGGLGTGVAKATTSVLGKSLASKVAGRLVGSAAQTAAQVPMMVQGTAERMTDRYVVGEDGQLVQASEGEGFGEALLRTYANNYLENVSERLVGDAADKLARKGVGLFLKSKTFGKTPVADLVNWTRKNPYMKLTNRTLGLNTPLSENIEEAFTGLTQPFVTEDNWKGVKEGVGEYFTGENLYRTFLTTAAMGATMGGAQFPFQVYNVSQSEQGRKLVEEGFDEKAHGLFYGAATAETVEEREKYFTDLVKLTGLNKKEMNPVMHYYQTVLSQIENGIDPRRQPEIIQPEVSPETVVDPKIREENKVKTERQIQIDQKIKEVQDDEGNVTTVEVDGQKWYVKNSQDLGKPGWVIFIKNGTETKAVKADKLTNWTKQTPEEVKTDIANEDAFLEAEKQRHEAEIAKAANKGIVVGAEVENEFGTGVVTDISKEGVITAQDEEGKISTSTLDETAPVIEKPETEPGAVNIDELSSEDAFLELSKTDPKKAELVLRDDIDEAKATIAELNKSKKGKGREERATILESISKIQTEIDYLENKYFNNEKSTTTTGKTKQAGGSTTSQGENQAQTKTEVAKEQVLTPEVPEIVNNYKNNPEKLTENLGAPSVNQQIINSENDESLQKLSTSVNENEKSLPKLSEQSAEKIFDRLLKDEAGTDDYGIHGLIFDWNGSRYDEENDEIVFDETRSGTGTETSSKKEFIDYIISGQAEKEIPSAKDYIKQLKAIITEDTPAPVTTPELTEEQKPEVAKSINPNQPAIDKLKAEITGLQGDIKRKEKEINDRNGLFGDVASTPTDLFGQQGFDTANAKKVIEGYKAEISRKQSEIDKLTAAGETAAKEVQGQKELVIPETPDQLPDTGEKVEPELYSIKLMSKNNKQTGIYLYSTIIKIGDKYHFGESVKTSNPITKSDVNVNDLKIGREISEEFYEANGIKKVEKPVSEDKKEETPGEVQSPEKVEEQQIENPVEEITTENELEVIDKIESEQTVETEQEEDVLDDNESGETLEKLQDFGEKIGAARKDLAQRGYKMTPNSIPGWARKFNIGQFHGENTWTITVPQGTYFKTLGKGFKTKEEAHEALPLIAVSLNHRVYMNKDGKWSIFRKWSSGKQWEIKGGFETRDDAMKYMAENAVDIITKRSPVIERPHLDRIKRNRKDWRGGKNVTPEQFLEKFGFRGGEFGNWLASDERQSVLNMAYDAFMDMSEILGISPRALSMKGELSIGFGSRGHGLQGAAAHYEKERAVINLTRINGAGSLAHEWFHALDNYLAKLDGKSSSTRQEDGTFKQEERKFAYFSHGESTYPKTKVRNELLAVFKEIMNEINTREVVKDYDIPRIEKQIQSAKEDFDGRIAEIRDKGYRAITRTRDYGQKKKPATPEQLKKFDELVEKIRNGEIGEDKWHPSAKSRMKGKWMYDTEKEISDLVTQITGAAPNLGYGGNDNTGFLYSAINRIKRSELELSKAKAEGQYQTRIKSLFKSESESIDVSRSGSYWASPHEMAARAFEAFLEDETLRTGESQYLVYGARNIFYAMMGVKPYPEGQERVNIDNAFRKLFDTIQEKEEDGKAVLFRLAEEEKDNSETKSQNIRLSEYEKYENNISEASETKPYNNRLNRRSAVQQEVGNWDETRRKEFPRYESKVKQLLSKYFNDKQYLTAEEVDDIAFIYWEFSSLSYQGSESFREYDVTAMRSVINQFNKFNKNYPDLSLTHNDLKKNGYYPINSDPRFRILGETGAANLDKAEREERLKNANIEGKNSDMKPDPRGGVYNSPEYRLANKVQSILSERGINKNFTISETDFGNSMYFTVYGENTNEPKSKIRISDHSVSNKDRIFGEQHESSNSDPNRIADDIELSMHPERYDKIKTGVRYYSKWNNQWITEPVENGYAWVKSRDTQATESMLNGLNPETARVVSKTFLRESKSGNKIYDAVIERRTEVGEEPIYKYERKAEYATTPKAEEATTRLDNLAIAREMETDGKDEKSIKLATGWERGAKDNKWKYEVPDIELNFTFDEAVKNLLNETLTLSDVVNDTELFKAYPELKNTKIQFYERKAFGSTGGTANSAENTIRIVLETREREIPELGGGRRYIAIFPYDDASLKSVLSHEIQHLIQGFEGFARGGNRETVLDSIIKDRIRELQKALEVENLTQEQKEDVEKKVYRQYPERYRAYQQISGEVEARNVQRRIALTPEQRRESLLAETQDVATKDQIFLSDGLNASLEAELEVKTDPKLDISDKAQPDVKDRKNALNSLEALVKQFGVPISVIHSSEIGDEIGLAAKRKKGTPVAFYYNGTAYIISDKVTSVSDVKQSYLHEAILHKGLDLLFEAGPVTVLGKAYNTKNELLDEVYNRLSPELISEIAKEYVEDYKAGQEFTPKQQREIAEEALAKLNELEIVPSRLEVFMDSLWKFIKKLVGFSSKQFTRTELHKMLADHRKQVQKIARGGISVSSDKKLNGALDFFADPNFRFRSRNPETNRFLDEWEAKKKLKAEKKVQTPPVTPPKPPVKKDATPEPEQKGGKIVDKTIVTKRTYEGDFGDAIDRELEKKGLTRETQNQKEAEQIGLTIIEMEGLEGALNRVRSGEIGGAPAGAIWHEKLKDIDSKMNAETNPEMYDLLAKEYADITEEMGNVATLAGQFSAFFNYIYQTSDLGFNAEKLIRDYKLINNGEITPELEEKFKKLANDFKEVQEKLAAEQLKVKELEEQAAVDAIRNSIERQNRKKAKASDKIREKTDKLVALIDLGKLNRPGIFSAATPGSLAWDLGLETVKTAVKATGRTIEAIAKGWEAIKSTDWYKELDAPKQRQARNAYFDFFTSQDDKKDKKEKEIPTYQLTKNGLKIPHAVIRDLVEQGMGNIDDLTQAVYDIIVEDFPEITMREVRDAITGYGSTMQQNQEEIEKEIRKMKFFGRVLSGLEDVAEGERPKKSGLQRDKPDPDQRAANKQLREAMKLLPVDEQRRLDQQKTQLDTAKQRLINQIEDLQREIDKGELTPKNARTMQEDDELRQLRAARDAKKAEHAALFNDEEFLNKKRIELSKKAVNRRIAELEKRIADGDFAPKKRKEVIADTELIRLRAEKLRIQEEYKKEMFKAKLRNRTQAEKVKDGIWDAWGITRALRATGEFSFVGIQGLINTIAHPIQAKQAFKNSMRFLTSQRKADEWMNTLKSQDYYQMLKESKLAITEPNAELTAREELFYSGWTDMIWNNVGKVLGKDADSWMDYNPLRAIERAAVGYLDTQRVLRYMDGVEMLKEKGIEFTQANKQAYVEMADVINTFTGRGSIGRLDPELLTKIFFSPRNWASVIKTATPYAFYHFGKKRAGAEAWKPSVAQKMALADFSKFVALTASLVALAAIALNGDDDDENKVELDPRSTDFGKIKIGDTRIDPWGGRIQQIVLISRLLSGDVKNSYGEVTPIGTPYKSPTGAELLLQMATNKLAPSASILYKHLSAKVDADGNKVDTFGEPYSLPGTLKENLYPIYWETLSELAKDDITVLDGVLAVYAFFGGGVNVYDQTPEKMTDRKLKEQTLIKTQFNEKISTGYKLTKEEEAKYNTAIVSSRLKQQYVVLKTRATRYEKEGNEKAAERLRQLVEESKLKLNEADNDYNTMQKESDRLKQIIKPDED